MAAYVGTKGGQGMLAVVNKGPNAVQLKLPDRLGPEKVTQRWELRGELSEPALDAKDGVRFERGQVPGGKSICDVNGYSAVILHMG